MSVSASLSKSESSARSPSRAVQPTWIPVDFVLAVLFIVIYGFVIHAFQYRDALGESDLYRVLVGLMDGATSGQGLASDLHYDRDFGFGYLAAIYAFVDPTTLRDPDRLMALMNQVGFWSMLPTLLLFWCAVRLVHGATAALVALVVFAFGPNSRHPATRPFRCSVSSSPVRRFCCCRSPAGKRCWPRRPVASCCWPG
jgi:hypothetical protein